jgi:hypothetical protein
LEIISPAGFENYFRELGAELISGPPDPQRLAALCAHYALDMDMSSIPGLIRRSLSGSTVASPALIFGIYERRYAPSRDDARPEESPTTSGIGPSRHFAVAQQLCRFRREADINWLAKPAGPVANDSLMRLPLGSQGRSGATKSSILQV